MAKLSFISDTGISITVEFPEDSDIGEFLGYCKTLAIGATYHVDSWKDAICELADEIRSRYRGIKK